MHNLKSLLAILLVIGLSLVSVPVNAQESTQVVTDELNIALFDASMGSGVYSIQGVYEGCYGNQLDDFSRMIYEAYVDEYVVKRQSGSREIPISDISFKTTVNNGNLVVNDEYSNVKNKISSATQNAMNAFCYDYPQVYWFTDSHVSTGMSYSVSGDIATVNITGITIYPHEIYEGASLENVEFYQNVDMAVEKIKSSLPVSYSRYDTVKAIHDYVCDTVNYAYSAMDEDKSHSAEPVFIGNKLVVCEGYAKSVKILCDRFNIPCALIIGNIVESGENHMWNYIQMEDKKWYMVDATWDDQQSNIYDTYLLVGKNTKGFEVNISKERVENKDFSGQGLNSFTYPVLAREKYIKSAVHVHTEVVIPAVAPTTEKEGSTEGKKCSVCGETIVAPQLIPKKEIVVIKHLIWESVEGKAYWYENGIKQGTYNDPDGVMGDGTVRGREIYDSVSDGWYWLDACYDGAKACNKEVWMPYIYQNEKSWDDAEINMNAASSKDMATQVTQAIKDGTGKWVRYDVDGKMYKGWYTVEGADAVLYPSQVGNTYYYDPKTGLMAKGKVAIDGVTYNFDVVTGVLIK